MKKSYLYTILFQLISIATQSQNWQWARQLGSPYQFYGERVNSIITDGANSYVIGSYGGILYMATDTLYSNGNNDIFISKFDSNGNKLWVKSLGGNFSQPSDFEDASGVYDSLTNSIYIAGSIIGSVYFGGTISLNANSSNADIFISRMDLSGNFLWAHKAGGSGSDRTYIFRETNGNVLLAGQVPDTSFFDTIKVNPGGFFARYDSTGKCLWAEKKFSGPENSEINISFIGPDIIMGGFYNQNFSTIDTATLILSGTVNGYLTRMDSMGRIEWIKTFGGPRNGVSGVAIDNTKNIYITGGFEDTIHLDTAALVNSNNDIYIAKFNEDGNIVWVKQMNATGGIEAGVNIISDSNGNCYLTGIFSGSASFDYYNISTSNQYDMFLVRYDSSGNCFGVDHFGRAVGMCISDDNNGGVICGGAFLDTISIGNYSFISYTGQDIFIAKHDAITDIEEGERRSNQLLIYSNPSQGTCNVTIPDEFKHEKNLTLSIYDNTGKLIQQGSVEMNEEKVRVNLESEAKGIYNVTLSNGKKSYGGKIVFE